MKAYASILLCVLAWAQAAQADVFAILPPHHQGEDGTKVGLQIARLIEADLAEQNVKVLPPEQTVTYVPKDQRVVCDTGECAEHYRAVALATAVISIRVYRAKNGPGPATSFQIAIQPKLGVEYARGGVFGGGSREDAVKRVFRDVLAAYRNPGPWLQVLGEPKGADVYLDDRRVGVLPWTDRVSVGMHQLRVEAAGFEPQYRLVPLSAPGASVEEKFSLEPALMKEPDVGAKPDDYLRSSAVVTRPNRRQRTGIALLTLGAPALVVGAVWMGIGLRNRDRSGACERFDPVSGTCSGERPAPDSNSAVAAGGSLAAVGVVALIAGSVLVAKGRRANVQLHVGAGNAFMSVRRSF